MTYTAGINIWYGGPLDLRNDPVLPSSLPRRCPRCVVIVEASATRCPACGTMFDSIQPGFVGEGDQSQP